MSPSKEEFYEYLPDHVKQKYGYKGTNLALKHLNRKKSRDSSDFA
jgi:hypothetical protein